MTTPKKEKLVLIDLRRINVYIGDPEAFKIKKAVNTIEYKIGEYLSVDTVNDLIKYQPNMTVEIIERNN